MKFRQGMRGAATILAVGVTVGLAGCANSGSDGDDAGGSGGPAAAAATSDAAAAGDGCTLEKYGVKKFDLKGAKIGFSQSEPEAAAFRTTETQSIKDEAAKQGVILIATNANNQLSKQISDIQDMIAKGVQGLIVAPLNSDGLEPALSAAKAKGIPVVTIDRKINATPCSDYLTFIGSDFVDQGKRAAEAMLAETGGKANVAILLGSSGNNVTTDRTSGFVDTVKSETGVKIVAQQTGEFARDKGQSVTETLLQAHKDIDTIYAENDEMGLGAMAAIRAAGKTPGKDIKIFSIDGTRDAVQAIVDGTYNGVIESNPRFGPLAFQQLADLNAGQAIPEDVVITDGAYTPADAKSKIADAY
jgi:ABC-type sugar transport system substrate-binding protein